jgi:hypothetical protein
MTGNPNSYYAQWADHDNKPPDKQLNAWNLSTWIDRKIQDLVRSISDINHTRSIIDRTDELLIRALRTEEAQLKYLGHKFPINPKPENHYSPQRVDLLWVGSRIKEIERQRRTFSNMAYWVDHSLDKTLLNACAQVLSNEIEFLSRLITGDWTAVAEALQIVVEEIEAMQLVFVVIWQRNEGWTGALGKMARSARSKYRYIHNDLLELQEEKYDSLVVRNWEIDVGFESMTWDEFREREASSWRIPDTTSGPPLITDGPIFKKGLLIMPEQLANERRKVIDEHLDEWSGRRFGVVKNILRKERRALGEILKAVGRLRGWNLYPGQIEEMVAKEEEILDDE